jgi:glycosyltransferase involved in cell wall biosynthesis
VEVVDVVAPTKQMRTAAEVQVGEEALQHGALCNDARRKRDGASARQRVVNGFSARRMVREYEEIYSRLGSLGPC